MRVAVVCKDALLRDGILSLLAHEGAFDVAAGGEHVTGITRAFTEEGPSVLVAVADMLDTDDWVQLNQIRAGGTSISFYSSPVPPQLSDKRSQTRSFEEVKALQL